MLVLFTQIKTEIYFSFKNDDKEKLLSSVDTILGFQTENKWSLITGCLSCWFWLNTDGLIIESNR